MRRAVILAIAFHQVLAAACTPERTMTNDAGSMDVSVDTAPSCPTSLPADAVPVQIAGGRTAACVLLSDTTVACWSPGRAPYPVCGVDHAVEVAVGNDVACARIDDGTVRCWSLQAAPDAPAAPLDGIVQAIAISAGLDVCAIRADHTVHCVQFANGEWFPVATPVAQRVRDAAAGSTGEDCAVLEDGSVTCWMHSAGSPVAMPVATVHPHDAQHVAVGNGIRCALDSSGPAECWGGPIPTELRDPMTLLTPIAGTEDVTEIHVGAGFGCARTSTGGVLCFGDNTSGSLGDGSRATRWTPASPRGSFHALGVAVSDVGVCVLTDDHAVYCFGDRRDAPVSAEPELSPTTPLPVPGLHDVTDLVVGPQNACARTSAAWLCWGSNVGGLIDFGSGFTPLPPTDLRIGLGDQPAFGAGFACVRDVQGAVSCWGQNASGQLGDGTTTPHADPRPISGLNARSIVAGTAFACALTSTDAVYCWGVGTFTNPYHQRSMVLSPMAVAGLGGGMRSLVANDSDACAIDADGAANCWGDAPAWGENWPATLSASVVGHTAIAVSASTQGGCVTHDIGTVECWGRYAPAIDPLGARAVNVAVGGSTACLLDASGASHCWGGVASTTNVRAMYAREEHGCLLGTDGTVSCWGADGDGFLGRGIGRYITEPTRFGPWGP